MRLRFVYAPGSRQNRGKSGSAACLAESLWLSGANSLPSPPRLGWKAEPSSRAEGLVRAQALGKAKPFRTPGGKAAPALSLPESRILNPVFSTTFPP